MKKLILESFIGIIVFGGVIVAIIFPLYLMDKNIMCPKLGESLKLNTKYNFFAGGCFVEIKTGEWILEDNYQGINIK